MIDALLLFWLMFKAALFSTSGTCSMREYMAVSRIVIATLGSSSPASASATPTAPDTCQPIKITSPRILIPGAIWQMPQ